MNIPEELEKKVYSLVFRCCVLCPWPDVAFSLLEVWRSPGHGAGWTPFRCFLWASVCVPWVLDCECCCGIWHAGLTDGGVFILTKLLSGLMHFGLKFIIPPSEIVMFTLLLPTFAWLWNAFPNHSSFCLTVRIEGLALWSSLKRFFFSCVTSGVFGLRSALCFILCLWCFAFRIKTSHLICALVCPPQWHCCSVANRGPALQPPPCLPCFQQLQCLHGRAIHHLWPLLVLLWTTFRTCWESLCRHFPMDKAVQLQCPQNSQEQSSLSVSVKTVHCGAIQLIPSWELCNSNTENVEATLAGSVRGACSSWFQSREVKPPVGPRACF